MIIYDGTKLVGEQTALVFKNDQGQSVDLVLNAQTLQFILQNFERLSPAKPKNVEYVDPEPVEGSEMIRIYPEKKKTK